jgi:hypothetical protein
LIVKCAVHSQQIKPAGSAYSSVVAASSSDCPCASSLAKSAPTSQPSAPWKPAPALSPQPDTLKGIARVLNLSVSDLYVLTDWLPADELPTLKPYLRAKYHDLDEQAIADIEAYANQRAKRHGGTGPVNREDEQP